MNPCFLGFVWVGVQDWKALIGAFLGSLVQPVDTVWLI